MLMLIKKQFSITMRSKNLDLRFSMKTKFCLEFYFYLRIIFMIVFPNANVVF